MRTKLSIFIANFIIMPEISGIIDLWGCPIFKCDVANEITSKKTSVTALIDTGCFYFCLKQKFIDALELLFISSSKIKRPKGIELRKKYKGSVEFSFGILSNIEIMELDESFNSDFIIGTNFLYNRLFSYDGQRKIWRIFW